MQNDGALTSFTLYAAYCSLARKNNKWRHKLGNAENVQYQVITLYFLTDNLIWHKNLISLAGFNTT